MGIQEIEPTRTSVELEFQVQDEDLFFVRASALANCRVQLAEMVHRSDGRLLEYFTVAGTTPDDVLDAAATASAIDDARVIHTADEESLVEFVISGPCIGGTLADEEAVVREVVAVDGVGRVVAYVPDHVDVRDVVETVRECHDVDLLARRERDRPAPAFTGREFRDRLRDQLTQRQWETLRTAYASGYFDWPRGSTAEDCADALGIAQPTFAEHIRACQRKLLDALLDDAEPTPREREIRLHERG